MKETEMKCALILLAICFLSISGANAATINAASCSTADVNSAITRAATGDTISVPVGNCTWSGPISVSKQIKLIGAGIGNTNVTCSSGACITSDGGAANNVRVSGFTFSYSGSQTYYVIMNGTEWRVDHNRFAGGGSDGEAVVARSNVSGMFPYGLVDNNQIVNLGVCVYGSYAMLEENSQQHVIWAQNPDLGGGNSAVYIEQNAFTKTVNGITNAVDANYGGRYVFRYNTVTTNSGLNNAQYLEAHSVQGSNRATQRWEIYGNTINNQSANVYEPFRIRGGTGVVFNNSILGNWSNYEIALDNVRSRTDEGETFPQGYCDGTSNWDGNQSGQTGYPCRDQIGYGKDAAQWAPGQAWNQVKMPVYEWNNKKADGTTELPFVQIVAQIGNPIQANRDYYNYSSSFNGSSGLGKGTLANRPPACTTGVAYWATDQGNWNNSGSGGQGVLYKCTATNTWTLYYTPHTYPHPLQGGGSGVAAPQNLRIAP